MCRRDNDLCYVGIGKVTALTMGALVGVCVEAAHCCNGSVFHGGGRVNRDKHSRLKVATDERESPPPYRPHDGRSIGLTKPSHTPFRVGASFMVAAFIGTVWPKAWEGLPSVKSKQSLATIPPS